MKSFAVAVALLCLAGQALGLGESELQQPATRPQSWRAQKPWGLSPKGALRRRTSGLPALPPAGAHAASGDAPRSLAPFPPPAPSRNTANPCYKNPTTSNCAGFLRSAAGECLARQVLAARWQRPGQGRDSAAAGASSTLRIPFHAPADWVDDLAKLCRAMPYMTACTLKSQCGVSAPGLQGSRPGPSLPVCPFPAVVAAVCCSNDVHTYAETACQSLCKGTCHCGSKI